MIDLSFINTNSYVSGISLLLLNIGSRYLMGDISKFLENIFQTEIFKKIILFALFFVATRDIIKSFVLTLIFSVLIYGLFNEKSRYSLIPNDEMIKKKLQIYNLNMS
jgi:hypothetical protein